MLRDLLQHCSSVKTVRLCLQFGRELSLPWAAKLDSSKLPTGSARAWVSRSVDGLLGTQAMNQTYLDTTRLLTQVAPLIFADSTFALKGGTAINLFIRDMPRLSVDLDLVFTDHSLPRDEALARINEAIRQSAERLKTRGFQTHVLATVDAGETKLLVRRAGIEVKVEVNFVMRGTVYPVRTMAMTPMARDTLLADLEIPVVSLEDVYGGKLVAAIDRQHPRDLFDVMPLFTHEGVTAGIRRAFVVYLASHNRPVHEVLFPAMAAHVLGIGIVDLTFNADGTAAINIDGQLHVIDLGKDGLSDTYSNIHEWLILSHLSVMPFAMETTDGLERVDPQILMIVGTADIVLRKPGGDPDMRAAPTHDLPGIGSIVCHKAGIIKPITYSIFAYLAREGSSANGWIEQAIALASMPLLGRIHIALLQISSFADKARSVWAQDTLANKIAPAFKVLPDLHGEAS